MSNCRVCHSILEVGNNWYTKGEVSSNYICNDCRKIYYQRNKEKLLRQNKEWRERNREKLVEMRLAYREKNREKIRGENLKRRYGISSVDFDAMLLRQDGKCAICGTSSPGGRNNSFHVDHDHTTGIVRGLLCHHCNTAIGKFNDDPVILAKAILYLKGKYEKSTD
jgi:hypothetical protein